VALTICKHCSHLIWVNDHYGTDRMIKAPYGPPEYGRVTGIRCPKCEQIHPAPGPKEEDWFE
jgi:hypothetical protein